ncbi:caspase family protein [Bradyrhizobium aeschynomenes]|uniref:caspase family protein n=1 Tax=Bradyrhizobium aeschynomenes TaxID=2734909 RepID=UPI001556AE6F|nr:caspase domain-containing protein [Bradyrhizobium aeschynomenes]NPV22422.1 caspase-like domain-containing protein [Bradyrhizobium aeschynomenes]
MRLANIVFSVTFCLLVTAAWHRPAEAQQPAPEKRIALVVGNGAYAKGALATAANDAGLIAQTLQAAGFDVVGARDLDADTLRKSFRDFIHKAQSSDGNTVAMVYLAGYGMQLAGENYFLPVDANVTSDVDIPTEGLRLSDYVRQLAAVPLKAGVVVLDAARQQPFITGGSTIAGGLALVEPDNNMLIAFNAAPGTIAPNETGSYGVYARSLAEMIRTGGLSLSEVFDRLRLRVNEETKGAQVPWDAQKVQAAFTFFERAPDAPATQASPEQTAALRARPIRELPVQEAYAAALERDSLQGYEDFIAAYPSDPLARRVRAIVAARREALTWRRTYRTDSPEAYWSYLKRYPYGAHAADARRRLSMLSAQAEPPPTFAMIEYDVPPPPLDEVIYVERPVLLFSDPEFGFVPPPPPPVYVLPPPPPEFVDLPPPYAPVGLFILPRPVFVPIPVYVRPPAFVAPPPSNIIYQNIHNTTVINTVINRPAPPAAPMTAGPAAATSPAMAVAPALPPAVVQRATLIQQGKVPPPGPLANPAGRPGAPPAVQANAPSGGASPAPGGPGQGPSPVNALPVPGRGGPPVPPSVQTPNPHVQAPASPGPGQPPSVRPDLRANRTPAGAVAPPPAGPSATPARPAIPSVSPRGRVPEVSPRIQQAAPPIQRHAPPPATARLSPPPAPPRPPVAPMVRAAPPRPAPPPQVMRPAAPPQMARPAPPPPMMRSAPPPQMARPAPPPQMARPSPPPMAAVARPAPAPPPMMARPAPPPPRPAPPPQAAGKRCPPNVPHC